jgi:hypothetical protein
MTSALFSKHRAMFLGNPAETLRPARIHLKPSLPSRYQVHKWGAFLKRACSKRAQLHHLGAATLLPVAREPTLRVASVRMPYAGLFGGSGGSFDGGGGGVVRGGGLGLIGIGFGAGFGPAIAGAALTITNAAATAINPILRISPQPFERCHRQLDR